MWGKSYAYPDLYEVLVKAQSFAKTPEEERLSQVVLSKFRHVGAHLPEKQRHELEELDGRCSTLCFTAEQNINEDCSSVVLSVDELEGCAETFIQSLPDDAGMKRCSLKADGWKSGCRVDAFFGNPPLADWRKHNMRKYEKGSHTFSLGHMTV